jgi:hypothetical protein
MCLVRNPKSAEQLIVFAINLLVCVHSFFTAHIWLGEPIKLTLELAAISFQDFTLLFKKPASPFGFHFEASRLKIGERLESFRHGKSRKEKIITCARSWDDCILENVCAIGTKRCVCRCLNDTSAARRCHYGCRKLEFREICSKEREEMQEIVKGVKSVILILTVLALSHSSRPTMPHTCSTPPGDN